MGLEARGVALRDGMTPEEFESVEEVGRFRFPSDLRTLLSVVVPSGEGFPDWRALSANEIEQLLAAPIEGVLLDVSRNAYWLPQWGVRPRDDDAARDVVVALLKEAPALIPVFGHRYMPESRVEGDQPVFSVVQTDVIVYGGSLEEYFRREFSVRTPHFVEGDSLHPSQETQVPFWGDIVRANNTRLTSGRLVMNTVEPASADDRVQVSVTSATTGVAILDVNVGAASVGSPLHWRAGDWTKPPLDLALSNSGKLLSVQFVFQDEAVPVAESAIAASEKSGSPSFGVDPWPADRYLDCRIAVRATRLSTGELRLSIGEGPSVESLRAMECLVLGVDADNGLSDLVIGPLAPSQWTQIEASALG